jgi:hypothetical protein
MNLGALYSKQSDTKSGNASEAELKCVTVFCSIQAAMISVKGLAGRSITGK